MNKKKIYIITHKKFNNIAPKDLYTPIQVGVAISNKKLGYITDDTGDNISWKNKNYCELTGIYWIWKNVKDKDIVGICHYRRYFVKGYFNRKIIDDKEIKKYLSHYDIILPKKNFYDRNAYEQLITESVKKEDLDKLYGVIKNKYPNYIDEYEYVMKQNKMYQYNMMICNKKIYNDYCKWLFDILFELEKNIKIDDTYTDYQKRIYGFLAERLVNVWIYKNKLKIKELNVIKTDEDIRETIHIYLREKKNQIVFFLCRNIDLIKNKKIGTS